MAAFEISNDLVKDRLAAKLLRAAGNGFAVSQGAKALISCLCLMSVLSGIVITAGAMKDIIIFSKTCIASSLTALHYKTSPLCGGLLSAGKLCQKSKISFRAQLNIPASICAAANAVSTGYITI